MAIVLLPLCMLAQEDRFRYSPANPHPGDTVRFTYIPPAAWSGEIPHCVVRNVGYFDDHYCRSALNTVTGKVTEIDWKKVDKEYKGEIITSPQTALLTFSFNYGRIKLEQVADKAFIKEGKTDWNEGAGFLIRITDKENKPVPRANLYAAMYMGLDDGVFYRNNGFGMTNTKLALEYLDQELALYGPSRNVIISYSSIMNDNKNGYKEKAKEMLEQEFHKGLKSEDDYTVAYTLASEMGMGNLGNYLRNLREEKFKDIASWTNLTKVLSPRNGKSAAGQDSVIQQATISIREKIPPGRINSLENPLSMIENAKGMLMEYVAKKGDITLFDQYAEKYSYKFPGYDVFSQLIATAWLESGSTDALVFFKRWYDYFRKLEAASRKSKNWSSNNPDDAYATRDEMQDRIQIGVCFFSHYLNQYYARKNDFSAALPFAKTAAAYLTKINDLRFRVFESNFINVNCIKTMEKTLLEPELKVFAEQVMSNPDWDPYVKDVLRKIYVHEHTTEQGFDAYFRELRNKPIQNLMRSLDAKKIKEPAPPFTLTNLKGEQVSLKDMQGKVVVLDFWATWCGICIEEFPAMQEAVNSYQNDPNVAFFFVDGWEKDYAKNEESILKKVRHTLDTKKVNFNILLDKENKVVTDYNVPGMPFKFIIDKSGNIRYKINGGNRNKQQFIDELSAMIESLK